MKIKSISRMISFALSTLLVFSLPAVALCSKAYAASIGPDLLITEIIPMNILNCTIIQIMQ